MDYRFSRRNFLAATAAFVAYAPLAFAAPPTASLRPVLRGGEFYKRAVRDVDAIIADEKLSGQVAFAVAHAETGLWLETKQASVGTPPASVTKAITALYALDALGPEHRFETKVYATGGVVNGEVQGDLILAGGGDPTLDTDGLAALTASLKEAGVRAVKGKFLVYEASLPVLWAIDPAQPDHVGYNPGVSGLALNFNRVHFEWKRAGGKYAVTMDARTARYRPDVAMAQMAVRDRSTPVYTFESRGDVDSWTVAREALGNGGSRWLPVRKPGLYAGDVFATVAGSHGIRLGVPKIVDTVPEGVMMASHSSAPLLEILRDMLRFSNNLTAEMVGMAATKKRGFVFEDLVGSAAAMNRWAMGALDMEAPDLVDHSGLGDDSTVTARDMTKALIKVRNSALRPILKPFTMRDDNGRPMKDHPIEVYAKTGTLNFVSTLAGYLTAQDGTVMAFAIFASDQGRRAAIKREDREAPSGGRTWNRRAKRVQQALIERWGVMYGT
jgi:D-alanyl-D-alanine carboxypeptidase/D-alanyl-D-alanine-endopeptidase (penicillin-binding protein 4)